jgi:hypothetical protein
MKLSFKKLAVAATTLGAAVASHAAVDPAVTTAITGAQTDGLTVVTALTVMGATIWGATYIYRKFFR